MAHEIKIPAVGESISEDTLAQWLKNDGDRVAKGENIVVIDTEKASQDLPAEASGILKITVPAGTDVKIGQVIGRIEESGQDAGEDNASPAASNDSAPSATDAPTSTAPQATSEATVTYDIVVPSVGESVSEGTIAEWTRKQGEPVKRGDDIVVIDTEKASTDLQAEHDGTLEIVVEAGNDVKIGQLIGRIHSSGAGDSTPKASEPKALHVASPQPVPGTSQPPEQAAAMAASPGGRDGKPKTESPAPSPAPAPQAASSRPAALSDGQRETREPMSRMRRTIAKHLLQARNETAMLTTFLDVDMSAIISLRKKHQEAFVKRHGIKLGFMSFFISAACDALHTFPLVNASIDGNDIVHHHYVNMGVAVSTERGLAVPVIRDADQMSFAEVERALADMAVKARSGRIPLEELQGGTFTITNGGVFGSMMSTPLINPPQVAILGMHAIQERPVAVNGKVEIRPMMYLALSYDHRLIDGKEAVQFLVHLRDRVAAPERLLLGL